MILSTGSSSATRHLTDQARLEPFFISTYLPTTITKKIRLIKGKTHSQKSSQQVISVLFHLRDISKSIEREKTPPSSSKYDLSGVNVARKMKKTSTASYSTKDFCLWIWWDSSCIIIISGCSNNNNCYSCYFLFLISCCPQAACKIFDSSYYQQLKQKNCSPISAISFVKLRTLIHSIDFLQMYDAHLVASPRAVSRCTTRFMTVQHSRKIPRG